VSGRKNQIQFELIATQSLAASFVSAPTVINFLDNFSYQLNVTTTDSTGVFGVQASNDYKLLLPTASVQDAGTWVDLPLGPLTVSTIEPTVSAANDQILFDLRQLPYSAVRINYTSTIAGTGTVNIYISVKEIGG
jgi:hypothetical protein